MLTIFLDIRRHFAQQAAVIYLSEGSSISLAQVAALSESHALVIPEQEAPSSQKRVAGRALGTGTWKQKMHELNYISCSTFEYLIYASSHLQILIDASLHIRIFSFTYICIFVSSFTHLYIYIRIFIHVSIHLRIFKFKHLCIYVSLYQRIFDTSACLRSLRYLQTPYPNYHFIQIISNLTFILDPDFKRSQNVRW